MTSENYNCKPHQRTMRLSDKTIAKYGRRLGCTQCKKDKRKRSR